MRPLLVVALLSPLVLGLAACGDDDKTVVVNPQPSATVVQPAPSTTVVTPGGTTKVCPAGTIC